MPKNLFTSCHVVVVVMSIKPKWRPIQFNPKFGKLISVSLVNKVSFPIFAIIGYANTSKKELGIAKLLRIAKFFFTCSKSISQNIPF